MCRHLYNTYYGAMSENIEHPIGFCLLPSSQKLVCRGQQPFVWLHSTNDQQYE